MATAYKIPSLYREILKAAKRFPSKKRAAILEDIKTTFHEDKVSPAWQDQLGVRFLDKLNVRWKQLPSYKQNMPIYSSPYSSLCSAI